MIIWGSRTKREGCGFVLEPCLRCGHECVHFVASSKTKFTLYFVPTFTYDSKALLICTQCEWQQEVGGARGKAIVESALPEHAMLAELERRARANDPGRQQMGDAAMGPDRVLAVGVLVMALQVAMADGGVEDSESAAIVTGIDTIREATKSEPVRAAATLAKQDFEPLLDWIISPMTPPLPVMLAETGRQLRQLQDADARRYIGQLAWLCHTIAASTGRQVEAALERMDEGLSAIGLLPSEVSSALAFCDENGG